MRRFASGSTFIRRYGVIQVALWTLIIALLASVTLHLHDKGSREEMESAARNYYNLNRFYRQWVAGLGGVYAPVEKVEPNPYLAVPHREVTTVDGRRLTLVNPAYMSRMVFESIRASNTTPVMARLVSLNPLNPLNSPDAWERDALVAIERGEIAERTAVNSLNGVPYLRFISRFVTDEPCLKCHADQGYRVGEVKGAISISLPMSEYLAADEAMRQSIIGGYLVLWGLGSFGLTISAHRRHRSDEELRQSEGKFRTVCDWTQDWEYWVEPSGAMRYVSPSCEQVTGYSSEEFYNNPALTVEVVHRDDREMFVRHQCEALAVSCENSSEIEFRIVTRSGEVRWLHHACRPVITDSGCNGRRVSNRDITLRKQEEVALQRSEALNAALNRMSRAFLTSCNDEEMYESLLEVILDITRSRYGFFGYIDERGAMVCPSMTRHVWAECRMSDKNTVFPSEIWGDSIWGTALRNAAPTYENRSFTVPAGHISIERCLVVPLVYQGSSIGIMTVANSSQEYTDDDLNMLQSIGEQFAPVLRSRMEREKAARELRESENKLRTIFDVVQAGIILINPEGIIIFANQRMAGMFGCALEELVGSPYLSHVHPDELSAAHTRIHQLIEGDIDYVHNERRYRRNDGTDFWGYLSACRHHDADGRFTCFVAAIADLTELKLMEEKRHKLEQQMLHVQKLESLGVLAGGIAHDFNNILVAITGNVSLALKRLSPGSPVEHHLKQIEAAADKAADLARQMLAYSGKGRFVLEPVDLNREVTEMTSMLEVSISKKAVLSFHLASPLPSIEADPTQIRQIVMNLAINASEAIGEKSGVISISTGCMECDRAYFAESWLDENLTEGPYVFLEVADTGCGMDRATLDRIFEPFFTTKFAGRGLGMAAILGIVRGHKGTIKVYSEPGKGSTFKILFPASEKPAELYDPKAGSKQWKGSGIVLLVDDEESIRAIGSEMLMELGFEVVCAEDGAQAVDRYRTKGREIAVVLLDMTMPHMNGEEAFRELRRIDPEVKVVLSSGFSEQEVTQKFPGKGVAGFIQKPYNLDTLHDVMSRVLGID